MGKGFTGNRKGFAAVRKSPGVLADLAHRADNMLAATGAPDLYVTDSQIGKNRARASLRSYGYEGALHELETRALERSVDAGGDE